MRLEGQKKLGYFPTPNEIFWILKQILDFQEKNKILDPCCGEGEVEGLNLTYKRIKFYGIELDSKRAKKAKEKLDFVLNADALNDIIISENAFDLLFLNPPYDYETGDFGESERLEIQFLRKYYKTLQQNGILVYIIPVYSFKFAYPYLAKFFKNIKLFKFPEDEFKKFKQGIIIAKRNNNTDTEKEKILKKLENYNLDLLPEFTEKNANFIYSLPEPKNIDIVFTQKSEMNYISKLKKILEEKNIHFKIIKELKEKYNKKTISPLKMPKIGHLALLVAGGYLNGLIEKDGKKYFIKGQTVREVINVEEEFDKDNVKQKEMETVKIKINLLDIEQRKIIELQ